MGAFSLPRFKLRDGERVRTSMSDETTDRVTADVMSGRDPKTPFIALTGVAAVVAVFVIVVLVLAFVIPRLVTGHWPL
jgi:hypothetical protein